jgi:hypothetical protein
MGHFRTLYKGGLGRLDQAPNFGNAQRNAITLSQSLRGYGQLLPTPSEGAFQRSFHVVLDFVD